MNYLNYEFLEEFKRLDKLCREIYVESIDNKLGVTMYIDDMERNSYRGKYQLSGWDLDLKNLKRVRNLRNEIAHSTYQSIECTQADIDYVKNFHTRILNRNDPLALIGCQRVSYDSYSSYDRHNNSNSRRNYQTQPQGCATFMAFVCIVVVILVLIVI